MNGKICKTGAVFLCLLMIAMVFSTIPVTAEEPRASSRADERAVLVEVFTATNCGYCPGSDGAVDRMISNYGVWAGGYWTNRTSVIEWHGRGDAYENADSRARATYFGVSGYPTVVFDGVYGAVGGSANANNTGIDNWYKGIIDGRPKDTVVTVKIDYTINPDWKGGTYNVTYSGVAAHTNTTLKARMALIEDINVTQDGALLRFTARKMVFNQDLTVNNGDVKYVSGAYTIDSAWNKYKLGFVAFLESDASKEVLGSGTKLFPGNKAPSLVPGNYDITMNEDTVNEQLNLGTMFSDPENAPLKYTISNLGGGMITTEVQTNKSLKFIPTAEWAGVEQFKIKADDGEKSAETTITVTVVAVNDPPTVKTAIADFSMNEGVQDKHINLGNVFTDVDNPTLTYMVSGADKVTVTINPTSKIVTIDAPIGSAGTENLTFTATDAGALFATDLVKVTVKDVNHAPTLKAAIPDKVMDEDTTDSSIKLSDHFADLDNDVLAYTVAGNVNIDVSINATNSVVTLAPKTNWNGVETISISANDNIASPVSDSFMVTVNPLNDNPVKTGDLEDIEFDEDSTYASEKKLDEIFMDPDGNTLTYEVSTTSEFVSATIQDDNSVKFTPLANWNGQTEITITVSDTLAELEYAVPITVTPINDAPTLDTVNPTGDFGMDEGTSKDFKVTASDIDNDQLYYSWFLDGKEISDAKTDAYTYSPDFKAAGTHKVKVAITDSKVEVIKEWKVTVKNINRAPTVNLTSPVATQKYKEGKVTFSADIADPDGDTTTTTWYIDNKPVPSSNMATVLTTVKGGTHVIKVTVSDGTASTSQEVSISVTKKPGTTPGFEAFILIGAVLAVAFLLRRRK